MKFENAYVSNFEGAFRGMRNPKNSWDKSDSFFGIINLNYVDKDMEIADEWVKTFHPDLNWPKEFTDEGCNLAEEYADKLIKNGVLRLNDDDDVADLAFIGPQDMKLAQTLIKAGPEHRKFLRQIFVSVDITAPLYWWKEMDTYKVATVANSTSTMHKLTSKPITLESFEVDDFNPEIVYYEIPGAQNDIGMFADFMIEQLEFLRQKYLETKDKKYWKELVRWLPESWLQTRTWTANYEVLHSIVLQRGHHKLETEWGNGFIKWCTSLPYAKDLIFYGEEREKIYNLYAQK